MRIGQLRKQIAIQQEQPTPDGAGGYALGWSTLATAWADISPITGREMFVAGHLESHVTHKVTIHWRNDIAITSDMRLLYDNRAFNIMTVMNSDESNRFFELLVSEGGVV